MEKDEIERRVKKKEEKERYLEHKRTLLKMEEENYSKLYVIRCYDGWYKIFGHSALFLSKHLNEKIGRTYNLNVDRDYGVRDQNGMISIPPDKLEELKMRMNFAKLHLVREWSDGLEYEIGERLTEEDVVRMQHEDELIAARANEIVMPHVIFPELRAQVRDMAELIHSAINRQSKISKAAFLSDMERKAVEMNRLVIASARGGVKPDECLDSCLEMLEEIYEYTTTMADFQMVSVKKYWCMVKKIRAVEDQVKRELKKQAIRAAEKQAASSRRRNTSNGANQTRAKKTGTKATSGEDKGISSTKEKEAQQ